MRFGGSSVFKSKRMLIQIQSIQIQSVQLFNCSHSQLDSNKLKEAWPWMFGRQKQGNRQGATESAKVYVSTSRRR